MQYGRIFVFLRKTRKSEEKKEGGGQKRAASSNPPSTPATPQPPTPQPPTPQPPPPQPPTPQPPSGKEKEGGRSNVTPQTAKAGVFKGPRAAPKPGGSADLKKPLQRRSLPTLRSTPKPGVVTATLPTTPKPGGSAGTSRTTPKPGVAAGRQAGPKPAILPAAVPRSAVRGRSQEPGPSRIRTYAETVAGRRPSSAEAGLSEEKIKKLLRKQQRQRYRRKKAAQRAADLAVTLKTVKRGEQPPRPLPTTPQPFPTTPQPHSTTPQPYSTAPQPHPAMP
ncbi:uncharacterized protein [Prorops nasuta]|uniref:uncharacterized protein n=1 Tax=Prorops nasuta TaxID=863751 RepID=UPI0034CEB4C9